VGGLAPTDEAKHAVKTSFHGAADFSARARRRSCLLSVRAGGHPLAVCCGSTARTSAARHQRSAQLPGRQQVRGGSASNVSDRDSKRAASNDGSYEIGVSRARSRDSHEREYAREGMVWQTLEVAPSTWHVARVLAYVREEAREAERIAAQLEARAADAGAAHARAAERASRAAGGQGRTEHIGRLTHLRSSSARASRQGHGGVLRDRAQCAGRRFASEQTWPNSYETVLAEVPGACALGAARVAGCTC
jgi:hypothetical protein